MKITTNVTFYGVCCFEYKEDILNKEGHISLVTFEVLTELHKAVGYILKQLILSQFSSQTP